MWTHVKTPTIAFCKFPMHLCISRRIANSCPREGMSDQSECHAVVQTTMGFLIPGLRTLDLHLKLADGGPALSGEALGARTLWRGCISSHQSMHSFTEWLLTIKAFSEYSKLDVKNNQVCTFQLYFVTYRDLELIFIYKRHSS